jgi:hypothetical protein
MGAKGVYFSEGVLSMSLLRGQFRGMRGSPS